MKREEALAKFCEEEQNYIDGIKAGFLVKIVFKRYFQISGPQ